MPGMNLSLRPMSGAQHGGNYFRFTSLRWKRIVGGAGVMFSLMPSSSQRGTYWHNLTYCNTWGPASWNDTRVAALKLGGLFWLVKTDLFSLLHSWYDAVAWGDRFCCDITQWGRQALAIFSLKQDLRYMTQTKCHTDPENNNSEHIFWGHQESFGGRIWCGYCTTIDMWGSLYHRPFHTHRSPPVKPPMRLACAPVHRQWLQTLGL